VSHLHVGVLPFLDTIPPLLQRLPVAQRKLLPAIVAPIRLGAVDVGKSSWRIRDDYFDLEREYLAMWR
jgi:hypothetical protein